MQSLNLHLPSPNPDCSLPQKQPPPQPPAGATDEPPLPSPHARPRSAPNPPAAGDGGGWVGVSPAPKPSALSHQLNLHLLPSRYARVGRSKAGNELKIASFALVSAGRWRCRGRLRAERHRTASGNSRGREGEEGRKSRGMGAGMGQRADSCARSHPRGRCLRGALPGCCPASGEPSGTSPLRWQVSAKQPGEEK